MVHCPSCGAGLRFDIERQQMFCDHCQSLFDPQRITDSTYNDAKTENNFETYSYICPDCGAELMTNDKRDAIGFCPYCGGASMIFDRIRRDWKPDGVIPFAVTKEQCKQAYVKEVKRHLFVSRKYCKPELIESFRGIYMPYWSYEAALKGKFHITAESLKTGVVLGTVTSKTYSVTGTVDTALNGYTHDASIAFDDHLSEKLAPYDTTQQKPFNPSYLCGFYAETGDANVAEYNLLARQELLQHGCAVIAQDPQVAPKLPKHNLHFCKEATQLPLKITDSKQVLYPVWFMSYRRKDKITYATVNGQTGKVGADLPLSPLKIIIAALIGAAAVFGALCGVMTFLPSIKATAILTLCSLLMMAAVYTLQNAFGETVSKALHSDITSAGGKMKSKERLLLPDITGKLMPRYLFLVLVAVVTAVGYTTDGTYDKLQAMVMGALFILNAIPLVELHLIQARELSKIKHLQLSTESMLKSGILAEAKKLLTPLLVIRLAVYATTALHLTLAFFDLPSKTLYYALSGCVMAEMIGMCIPHIRFQTEIAKRRPPQFNKKGARYDEN